MNTEVKEFDTYHGEMKLLKNPLLREQFIEPPFSI